MSGNLAYRASAVYHRINELPTEVHLKEPRIQPIGKAVRGALLLAVAAAYSSGGGRLAGERR